MANCYEAGLGLKRLEERLEKAQTGWRKAMAKQKPIFEIQLMTNFSGNTMKAKKMAGGNVENESW